MGGLCFKWECFIGRRTNESRGDQLLFIDNLFPQHKPFIHDIDGQPLFKGASGFVR
jgi:hypothetical protein